MINTFGLPARRLPFPARVHARLTPAQLNEVYNRCATALALSFTNISLIPYELLAAGVLPVLNDWPGARAVLGGGFLAGRFAGLGLAGGTAGSDAGFGERKEGPGRLTGHCRGTPRGPGRQVS